MLEISFVHAVAQFCPQVYKRKKTFVSSSRALLIDIDPVLKVSIKRNDVFRGRLKFVNPSECNTWCVCEGKKRRLQYQFQPLYILVLAMEAVIIVWIFNSLS